MNTIPFPLAMLLEKEVLSCPLSSADFPGEVNHTDLFLCMLAAKEKNHAIQNLFCISTKYIQYFPYILWEK